MKKFNFSALILALTISLASFLRLWKLDEYPIHLTPDEAALGYNAYSISQTGRDEYGKLFPLIFKSFGDYKPGLYVYTAVPFIKILGLNEFSIRLPSALAGIISIYLIYQLTRTLFPDNSSLSIIGPLMLAISPWHIHFSRGAWEANLNLTISISAIILFIKGITREKKYILYAAILFGLTLWTYQGAKLSTPILIISILLAFKEKLGKQSTNLIKFIGIILLVGFPIIMSLNQSTGRLKVFSLFSYTRSDSEINELLNQDQLSKQNPKFLLFHAESIEHIRGFLRRYFNYVSGRFLFFEGDWETPRHSAPYHGVLYLLDAIFLILGLQYLLTQTTQASIFIVSSLLLGPVPAALSRDSINGVRAIPLLLPLILIIALGVGRMIAIAGNKAKYPIFIVIIFLYSISLVRFLDLELVHAKFLTAKYWSYGYKQLVKEITPIQQEYSKVIFNQSYDQPYIYFLFYQKYDPRKWWPQAKLNQSGPDVGLINNLDNIEFRPLSWSGDKYMPNVLIVGYPLSVSPNAPQETDVKLVKEILYPDKSSAFYIFASLKK